MIRVRQPEVAGLFYPAEVAKLTAMLEGFFQVLPSVDYPQPKAIIAPHAGYIYSGMVAAHAYSTLQKFRQLIKRVVLLGPAHRMYFRGIALTAADAFVTPLGEIPLATNVADLLTHPAVTINEQAYYMEHCLEVQLPFLQTMLENFTILPLLIGDVAPAVVAQVLATVWGDQHTLIVVSSDLSHYLSYDAAKTIDATTSAAILALEPEKLAHNQACGVLPIQGLLYLAKQYNLQATLLTLQNSGDTAGTKDKVVGYGAYYFSEQQQ